MKKEDFRLLDEWGAPTGFALLLWAFGITGLAVIIGIIQLIYF